MTKMTVYDSKTYDFPVFVLLLKHPISNTITPKAYSFRYMFHMLFYQYTILQAVFKHMFSICGLPPPFLLCYTEDDKFSERLIFNGYEHLSFRI